MVTVAVGFPVNDDNDDEDDVTMGWLDDNDDVNMVTVLLFVIVDCSEWLLLWDW